MRGTVVPNRGSCPFGPPQISLSAGDFGAIGRIAMLEARAKNTAVAALKGVANLSCDEWRAHHVHQFAQITAKLINAAASVDTQLHEKALELETLRKNSQDDRHQIVHAGWAENPDGGPVAYDIPRKIYLTRADIQRAINSNEATDYASYECMWLTAKLVEEGVIPQREDGAGPAMWLNTGLWKW